MPYARITVPLTTADRTVLLDIAEMECRDPREHLRYLLRRDAQERGLLRNGLKTKAAIRSDEQTRDDQDFSLATES